MARTVYPVTTVNDLGMVELQERKISMPGSYLFTYQLPMFKSKIFSREGFITTMVIAAEDLALGTFTTHAQPLRSEHLTGSRWPLTHQSSSG